MTEIISSITQDQFSIFTQIPALIIFYPTLIFLILSLKLNYNGNLKKIVVLTLLVSLLLAYFAIQWTYYHSAAYYNIINSEYENRTNLTK